MTNEHDNTSHESNISSGDDASLDVNEAQQAYDNDPALQELLRRASDGPHVQRDLLRERRSRT